MSTSPITPITDAQSWQLLRHARVGRLATSSSGATRTFTVNFVVDVDSLVFRTAPDWPLLRLAHDSPVTVEIDEALLHDSVSTDSLPGALVPGDNWSVVVTGRAAIITNPFEIALAERLPLDEWTAPVAPVFVRITPSAVTGEHGAATARPPR
ncbi:nitroimidazol reductase NimA-like FMN-containing flavoprotein (pyridoxamine 5'-phosphate oxidase superfamily) [Conyzicola lurida]|uniref:Nitroimidazol reductase NimA-like FMN-containing flavoprotein (Pyridoxamine 5'-phosphate oxidase superfamily) n=1 Tax=Conyzicola lurida TaxID=1172621 RepID=A0A841AK29_9MICO|nr:pyridoxamine 5'-phosphate oxidase family protein [Conyzicola lurida]MBB5842774.1 nitroimidazol reductase NimA-like FMN-containing flavoprotein (pyridoxamine 5'-phosphate oxidase superfamily) [Conyzicola lurida]